MASWKATTTFDEKIIRFDPIKSVMASSEAHEQTGSADYCAGLEKALREAMGVFGEDSVTAIIMALKG